MKIILVHNSSWWNPAFRVIFSATVAYLQRPDPTDDYLEAFLFDFVELRKISYKYNEKIFNFICIFLHVMFQSELLWNALLGTLHIMHVMHFNRQKKESPLIQSKVCCVRSFVLDYMHLVCLGVIRLALNFVRIGPAISYQNIGIGIRTFDQHWYQDIWYH